MQNILIPAVVAAYLLIMVGLSFLTSKKHSANADFFRGSRKSPWWAVAIAMVGTSISGVTFISVPGMVEASSFSYMQMALGFVAGYVVIAYVLLPLYYKLDLNSLYGYLDQRFGKCSYKAGAGFFLLSKVLGCGVRMYLTAIVLQLLLFEPLGIPFAVNVAATMLVVWLYTFRGGVRSLVWTDMLQTLSMVATVVLCLIAVGKSMGMDFQQCFKSISSSPMSRLWFFDDFKDTRYFWKQFLAGMFTTIAMTGLDQDMMQKNLSCRNLRESRKNVLSYGVAFIPVNLLFLALGVLLYNFAAMQGISVAKPDDLFPTIACGPYVPAAVCVFFVLGLVSASLSSAGSALTALTTTFTMDILRADRHQDEAGLMRTRRIVHICNAVLLSLVIIGFRAIGNGSVINAVYTVASYTYGPLLGLFSFGIFTKRPVRDGWVPFICILSPIICYLAASFCSSLPGGFKIGFELLIINALLTFGGLWLCGIGKSLNDKKL